MVPAHFVSLAYFHKWILRPGEPLSVITQELKWLLVQALPTADTSTSKQLLLHHFSDGWPSSLSIQLHMSDRPDL